VGAPQGPYDITIIGSGPGGYVAAVRAGQLGLKVAVVEMAKQPGGTCLHWGCIPAKAMLQAAAVLDTARHAKTFGIQIEGARLALDQMHAYKARTVQSNVRGVEYLFKKHSVTLLTGRGRLAGRGRVEVRPASGPPTTIETATTVLATGSVIRPMPGVEFDGKTIINSDDALGLTELPASMIVLGAGAVGVEFASIYRSFGCNVSLVELMPQLLPLEDDELGAELAKAFKKRGIEVHSGTRVERVERAGAGVRVQAEKKGERIDLEAQVLLVAIGRRPLSEDLGLEESAVRVDARGFIEVDAQMRTGEEGVYAIGDVVPTQALAHVASHEAVLAVEHAAGLDPHPIHYDRVPSCTYCQPEVASIGLTEREARRRGHDVAVGRFPFSAIGRAKILDETGGFVKIVSDKRYDEVLGVHIIGPHATELIAEATAALSLEATTGSLIEAIHAHPTLAEAMGEAALAVHGRALHI
jgi:dihydrolipoamide dehydrogenase